MVSFLYNWFSWVPILGDVFKGMYVTSLVGKIKSQANGWTPPEGLQENRENLDDALSQEADNFVDEFLSQMEVDLGLLTGIVKSQSVKAVVKIMRSVVVG